MGMKSVSALAVVASLFAAVPSLAQENDVCLRMIYVLSTKVHDSDTIIITDRRHDQYTVNATGVCAGLSDQSKLINFRPRTSASCLRHGDRISYTMPGDMWVSGVCLIDSIEEGAPS